MDPRDALPLVVYTKVDAWCDKLHGQFRLSNVDRRKYCQLSSTDNSLSLEFDKMFRKEVPLFLEMSEFLYNTV